MTLSKNTQNFGPPRPRYSKLFDFDIWILDVYSRNISFLLRVNLTIRFNHKKLTKEQSKKQTSIFLKLTKNLVIIASSLWTRY